MDEVKEPKYTVQFVGSPEKILVDADVYKWDTGRRVRFTMRNWGKDFALFQEVRHRLGPRKKLFRLFADDEFVMYFKFSNPMYPVTTKRSRAIIRGDEADNLQVVQYIRKLPAALKSFPKVEEQKVEVANVETSF